MNSVEQDEFDIQQGLQSVWAITFGVLYLLVMSISVFLYLLVVRAVARNGRRENVTYFLIFFLFFTALVEFALIIEEFMSRFGYFLFTNINCQLFTYTLYGNRILQICIVLGILYYNLLAVYLKTARFELLSKRYFPVLVVLLLLLEMVIVLRPTLNMRASIAEQWCEFVDQSRRIPDLWLYSVLFPYFLPLVASIGPAIYLTLRLKEGEIIEPKKSQVRVCLAVVSGYFLFYLLYFILLTAKQVEYIMLDRSEWNRLLGLSVWFITRPMFILIGHGWHIMVPLACLTLDKELRREWPGRILVREIREFDEEEQNSIVMDSRDLTDLQGVESEKSKTSHSQETELSPNFSALMLENREFHHAYPVH